MSRKEPKIRRIVTGHDDIGRAVVMLDGHLSEHRFATEHLTSSLVWLTNKTPADFIDPWDDGGHHVGTAPPLGGTRFAVIEILPGNERFLHRTDTVDYVICLEGEIEMDLDDSTVRLKCGDILIQRGTNHAWVNRSVQLARIAVILIDAEPKRTDSLRGLDTAR